MNIHSFTARPRSRTRPGYIAIMSVIGLSTVLLLTLLSSYRFAIQSQEVQRQAQLRIDYAHREQAILRAVLTTASDRAIQNMMGDSTAVSGYLNKGRWRWVFEHALDKSLGETLLDETTREVLGVDANAVSGNSGDGDQGHIIRIVSPIGEEQDGYFSITPGINGMHTTLGAGYPEALVFSDPASAHDEDRPVISQVKTYTGGEQFKAIPYPNIHFGYQEQNQTFVAKRNWWGFSIGMGRDHASTTGIERNSKDYVLSIYEVPSQLAIGSTATTRFGMHENGVEWDTTKIKLIGGVFATRAETSGPVSLDRVAAQGRVDMTDGGTIGTVTENVYTGELSSREEWEASHSNFFPLSSSSDSGLVAFIPINRGLAGFDDLTDIDDSNRFSPTSWNEYSRPALQCAMTLRIEEVVSPLDQSPTKISFRYQFGGADKVVEFTKGVNWPSASSAEGRLFPFHLDQTDSGRKGFAVYVERLAAYLDSIGADSLAVNHSINLSADYLDNPEIKKPGTSETDNIFILRDTNDLTRFTSGFSLVSPFRMYFANDVNMITSGTDASGDPIFPPLSLFAPEHRMGVKDDAVEFLIEGQVNYLTKNRASTVSPLDIPSGKDEEIIPENIRANLFSITDPDQLPPVNQMNWLVTIEEVRAH